ncbi:hypothetical protein L195_g064500, partial [Trifolium pratense]
MAIIPIRVERAKKPNSRIKQQQAFKQQRYVSVAAFKGAAIAQPPE